MNNYYEKYLKYKMKYLSLKTGGGWNPQTPKTYSSHLTIIEEFQDDCNICAEPISNGHKIIKLFSSGPNNCGHIVHQDCFFKYISHIPLNIENPSYGLPKFQICNSIINYYYETDINNTHWEIVYNDQIFSKQQTKQNESVESGTERKRPRII